MSTAPYEVDRDRHAFELEPVAELVLDPVAVVARNERGVVHEETEPRRPRMNLRPVEEIEPPAVPRRRLADLAELGQEPVQLGGRDPVGVLVELAFDPVEEARDASAGLGRDSEDR